MTVRRGSRARRGATLALALVACGHASQDTSRDVSGDWPVSVHFEGDAAPRFERVVLVTIDTLRADHVSALGYPRATTPFLDSLAQQGVLFTHALATISHTAPSHSSILTGLPPLVHGVLHNGYQMPADAVDLAHIFAAAGFETAACVNTEFLTAVARSFQTVHASTDRGEEVVQLATSWLTDERKTARFFLWVHLFDPHRWKDFAVEVKAPKIWRGKTPDGFSDYVMDLHGLTKMGPSGLLAQHWETVAGKSVQLESVEQYLRFVDAYDTLIQYADQQVRSVFKAVEALHFEGPTLWVVTADHGEGLASHGTDGHGAHIYQEQLHVPLFLFATDGSLPHRRVDALVSHLDLLPTLVETLHGELRAPAGLIDGRSLWPLVDGSAVDWSTRSVFSQRKPTSDELYALQTERFKLLDARGGEAAPPDGSSDAAAATSEFYDLASDPRELENRAEADPHEREALAKELSERLRIFRAFAQGQEQEIPEQFMGELRGLGYVR